MRLVHCLWITVLLVAVSAVSAEVELSISEAKCIEPSGIQLLVTNSGTDSMGISKTNIVANYFSSLGVGVDEKGVDKNFKISIAGSWEDDIISISNSPVMFKSAQNVLTYPGEYKITLTYEGCKSSYTRCEALARVTCPGVKDYGCKAYPLKIESCRNVDDILYVKFYNLEKGLLANLDPYKDIKYIFYGDKYHLDNELPNTTITGEADDKYLLKMKLMNGNRIDRIKMEHRVCGYIEYANCKIEGSGIIRHLNVSEENKTVYVPQPESKTQVFSNELIYIVAIIFVVTILFVIYHIRRKS